MHLAWTEKPFECYSCNKHGIKDQLEKNETNCIKWLRHWANKNLNLRNHNFIRKKQWCHGIFFKIHAALSARLSGFLLNKSWKVQKKLKRVQHSWINIKSNVHFKAESSWPRKLVYSRIRGPERECWMLQRSEITSCLHRRTENNAGSPKPSNKRS